MVCNRETVPIRGVLVVVGGFILHLTMGTQLTFGNMNPYFVSYIRTLSSPSDLTYVDGIWVQACMLMGQGVIMFLGGFLEHKLGLRKACLLGCWVMSLGVVLTYWTLTYNYVASVLTYGVMFGLGCGVAYPIPVTCAMRWFPNHRGLMGGLIFVGFGLGTTLFNQIITLYLNPNNILPDLALGEDIYFTSKEVLERVPGLFLVLGGTYAALQLVGVILIVNPPASRQETVTENDVDQPNGADLSLDAQGTTDKIWHTSSTENHAAKEVANGSSNDKQPSEDRNHLHSSGGMVVDPVSLDDFSVHCVPAEESVRIKSEQESSNTPPENNNGRAAECPETPGRTAVSMDIPPLQMLRTKGFYLVWLLFLFGGMGGVFMSAMYKSYGQSFIKDDQFIAIVGSCAAVFNALGGLVWGHVVDRFSFNVAAKLLYTMFACSSFTFIGSEYGLKPYFLVWVSILLFAISGKFTIMPPVMARMFGNKYMSMNYGLLYTSQILTAAASAFMGEMLKEFLHYKGLFFLIGGMSCIGFIITFFLDARTPDGKKI